MPSFREDGVSHSLTYHISLHTYMHHTEVAFLHTHQRIFLQSGIVNVLLTLLGLSIIDYAANRLSNPAARDGQIEKTVRQTVAESRRVLRHLIHQVFALIRLV
jgi:hypothetical protein